MAVIQASKIQSEALTWATRSLWVLVVVSWLGFVVTGPMEVDLPDEILVASLGLGLIAEICCLFMLFAAIPNEPMMNNSEKSLFRSHIVLAGPVGALEAYLWFRKRRGSQ